MTLEQQFDKAMMDTYKTTVQETKYHPYAFHELLVKNRGVKTAQILVMQDQPTEGFTKLYFLGRLDLTVEYLMLQNQFQSLFTTAELTEARDRLFEYGVAVEAVPIVSPSDKISTAPRQPRVTFDALIIGHSYDRPQLAKIWGYDDWHGFGRGVFTPRNHNKIVLFVTHKNQESLTQYSNYLDLDARILYADGERGHQHDERIINATHSDDEVYLFYRNADHEPFVYYGQVFLFDFTEHKEEGNPSKFRFALSKDEAVVLDAIVTEIETHGHAEDGFIPDAEGKKKIRQHIEYERSAKNRAMAIKIHGTKCKACGFDFNVMYGKDFAADYIEIHHTTSITEIGDRQLNPVTDLIPLCSNCHSMVHRRRDRIMPIHELKAIIDANR